MMHREVTAIVLCILAQASIAQCVAPSVQPTVQPVVASAAPHAATPSATAQPNARAELIKTAAAGTRDDLPPTMQSARAPATQQNHPRRGGTAMLLAALALMSGIALRRYASQNP